MGKLKSKMFYTLVCILISFINTTSQIVWEKISDEEVTGNIKCIEIDGDDNIYIGSNKGLMRSGDKGKTWELLYEVEGFWGRVIKILILEKDEIVIADYFGIKRSSDKGKTWSDYCVNELVNFLVCDNNGTIYTGGKPIYRSFDSGETWEIFNDEYFTWSMHFLESGNILIGTECGIYLSDDDGINWNLTGYFNCGDVKAIESTKDRDIIYIGGADRFHGIRFSTDKGNTWNYVENSDSINYVNSILPLNAGNIFYVSRSGIYQFSAEDNSIYRCFDEWVYDLRTDSDGYLYTGHVGFYRALNPVVSRAANNDPGINFSLKQNYPNPFNAATIIKYSLKTPSKVLIRVFNINGELISVLVNKEQDIGNYNVNFDSANLSTGVYFYQLIAGEYITTKKMLLLK